MATLSNSSSSSNKKQQKQKQQQQQQQQPDMSSRLLLEQQRKSAAKAELTIAARQKVCVVAAMRLTARLPCVQVPPSPKLLLLRVPAARAPAPGSCRLRVRSF
jgi:uncharacterized protein YkwD